MELEVTKKKEVKKVVTRQDVTPEERKIISDLVARHQFKQLRLEELLNPETMKKKIGEASKMLLVPRGKMLAYFKNIGYEVLEEVSKNLQAIEFSQK